MQNPRYAIRVSPELHAILIERGPEAVRDVLAKAFAPMSPEAAIWDVAHLAIRHADKIPDELGEAINAAILAVGYHSMDKDWLNEWNAKREREAGVKP